MRCNYELCALSPPGYQNWDQSLIYSFSFKCSLDKYIFRRKSSGDADNDDFFLSNGDDDFS